MINVATVVESLKERLLKNGLFIISEQQPVMCTHVNGLTAYGLFKLGYKDLAKQIAENMLASPLWNEQEKLFHREIDLDGKISRHEFNVCKNAFAICMYAVLEKSYVAELIRINLYSSAAHDKETGLFYRQFDQSGVIMKQFIIHTNLAMALAEIELGNLDSAAKIMESLDRRFYKPNSYGYVSIDCEVNTGNKYDIFYSDDQALAAIIWDRLDNHYKAVELCTLLIEKFMDKSNGLFFHSISIAGSENTIFTSYKNGWVGLALASIIDKQPYNFKENFRHLLFDSQSNMFKFSNRRNEFIADNSLLALLALNN